MRLNKALEIFDNVYIPREVKDELLKNKITKKFKILDLKPKFKDLTEIFVVKFDLHLGEAQAIALVLQEKADFF